MRHFHKHLNRLEAKAGPILLAIVGLWLSRDEQGDKNRCLFLSLSTLILFSAGYPHINWNSNSQSLRSLSVSQKGVFCANFVGSCQNQSEVLMKLVIEKKVAV
jgi:hypothetical protein